MSAASGTFNILNNIITCDDIIPIKNNISNEVLDAGKESHPAAPEAGEGSALTSSSEDADLLFSPLGDLTSDNTDGEDEEDEYCHGLLSPVYFHAEYPKRFHHNNPMNSDAGSVVQNTHSITNNIQNSETDTNSDFWNEVPTTAEEAVAFANNDDELLTIINKNSDKANCVESETSILSSLVTDGLENINNSNNKIKIKNWDSDAYIKLFCYRNKTGNFELKTQIDNPGTSGIGAKNNKIKKIKNGKRKFVRRKSGISQMISTNIGIGEFML
ncbi:hypothetical protein TPHA_0M01670 [Tetrapisispora phaffii CBS 4417]|uniref:Uncharacterized protein n=1 Tax=Tetrapisispora phaffii (strain ATCC 24235 / CBS 4417 / NBRC 1672 / NRRL Y-8282 / UCD 70-5) TaxID=1071381 RepID=G8C0M7_TETPH|nr:hypothetical protein TPHA_0M01670 [Tetrapisispora phaffii CBS 4417]CCE65742.1 hypothetical protein TPHA_0M01670 [Tetrapisispora phaffii CBS 4417]